MREEMREKMVYTDITGRVEISYYGSKISISENHRQLAKFSLVDMYDFILTCIQNVSIVNTEIQRRKIEVSVINRARKLLDL